MARTLSGLSKADPRPTLNAVSGLHRQGRLSFGSNHVGNGLVCGDNLKVLALLQRPFAGQIRCIYLDPPYNNNEQYTHYRDDLGHEKWLRIITEQLSMLPSLLRQDGSVWISIDDREMHYLKVTADKIFGRKNFLTTIIWQQRTTRENRRAFSNNHEYLLVYARDADAFKKTRNLLPLPPDILQRYRNPDNDSRGVWQSVSANVQAGHAVKSQFYVIIGPNGRRHRPPNGRCWVYAEQRMLDEIRKNNIWFGRDGHGAPRIKRFLNGARLGLNPETLWLAGFADTTDTAKKQLLRMFPEVPVFDTPKPEQLIHRILQIATSAGDLVLDPFLGSGTTAAAAHKMGRSYIGIEKNPVAAKLAAQRLRKVIEGDADGISKNLRWKGGGGFDYFTAK